MKNIKLNNNCFDFFKKNNGKICAAALSGVILLSFGGCANSQKDLETYQINEYEILNSLKTNVENNIENISVTKDLEKGYYIITENSYLEIPYYNSDENGKLYISHTEKEEMGTSTYNISFEEAEALNLIELLESKLTQKTK